MPSAHPRPIDEVSRPARVAYGLFFAYAANILLVGVPSLAFANLLFAAYPTYHAWYRLGRRGFVAFVAPALVVTWAVEVAGVRWGTIFGRYFYTPILGPQALGVPLFIPVAWAVLLYLSVSVADTALRAWGVRRPQGLSSALLWTAAKSFLGALGATAWDLGMDPVLSFGRMWIWLDGGAYFGVPGRNFVGWFVCAFAVLALTEFCSAFTKREPTAPNPASAWFGLLPILAYTLQILILLRTYVKLHCLVYCAVTVVPMTVFVGAAWAGLARSAVLARRRGESSATAADLSAWATRLRRAFSLRQNARLLFVPAATRLRPLDGIRGIAICWVIVFHSGWYSIGWLPSQTTDAMLASPWMQVLWRGDFAVDTFFVLSGFLIAGMLLDEHEKTGRVALGMFYARRLMRLWPALVAVVALDLALGDPNAPNLWATLLYVGNFLPAAYTAMPWTWSLAIEEQFYLLCPWLLRATVGLAPRARVAALGSVALAFVLLAAAIVVLFGLEASDAEIMIDRPLARWLLGADILYVKPWMRAGTLLAGVAAAILYRAPGVMQALARRTRMATGGLIVAIVAACVAMHWPLVRHAPRFVEVAYLAGFRTLFGLAIAYMMLLALSEHPIGKRVGRVLSWRALHPFSQLAYPAYLLNPLVAMCIRRLLGTEGAGMTNPLLVLVPLDASITFILAALLHLTVERPFMRLRPKASPMPSPTIARPAVV